MKNIEFIDVPSIEKAKSRKIKSKYYDYNFNPTLKTLDALKNKKYFIRTYGCQAKSDEEIISAKSKIKFSLTLPNKKFLSSCFSSTIPNNE